MRISDWSSDVCSSDLLGSAHRGREEYRDQRYRRQWPGRANPEVRSGIARRCPSPTAGRGAQPNPHNACCGYRSEEHTSELQSLMRISYAVFCLKKKKKNMYMHTSTQNIHSNRLEIQTQ